MPHRYCRDYKVTQKAFTENVLPIPTEDADEPHVTGPYIYEKYYKHNIPFRIKNAAAHLFENYADINHEYLIKHFDLTEPTPTNIASGRIVNLFESKSLQS